MRVAGTDAAERCKVCGGEAPLEGVVDFNKSCEEHRGIRFSLAGVAVYYRRCTTCGFLFTNFCDAWLPEDFRQRIYNADYAKVDPDYLVERPKGNTHLVGRLFGASVPSLRVLDYGGGNGTLAAGLRAMNFAAESYDPFDGSGEDKPGPYDLITCFEVMEHVTDPHGTVLAIADRLAPTGLVLFSTLLLPIDRASGSLDWWYIAPRNGHVSIHTADSLARLWREAGFKTGSFNSGMHCAYRALPDFARHLIREVPDS